MARVRRYRLAQGQARQTKSNKENRYVIKVMSFNKEGGAVPWVRENQRMMLISQKYEYEGLGYASTG
jgi:hypothetical protein